jgi:hypothetical protein
MLVVGLGAFTAGSLNGCVGAGPCEHTYRQAILLIDAARDAEDGSPLPMVALSHIRRNGNEQDPKFLVLGPPSHGVEVHGDSLVCHVPCGFATDEGNYTFTVSADGYPPQERTYEARYRVFKGGCPSYNDGGLRIVLSLSR